MTDTASRWIELADAQAVGDELSAEDLAFLREHADDVELADERALYADIERLGEDAHVAAEDRRRADATLASFRAQQSTPTAARTRRVLVVTAVVAAAAMVALWATPRGWLAPDDTLAQARVVEGSFVLAGDQLAIGATLPDGQWVRADAPGCVELDGGRACFDGGSELRVVGGTIELRSGAVHVAQGSAQLQDGDATRSLAAGDHFEMPRLEVPPPEIPRVEVREPTVPAVAPIIEPIEPVEPVEPATVRPTKPKPAPDASAGEMLASARRLANAQELGRAVAAYEALRRAYPDSADAHAADVSLGELQLRRGRPREALHAFDRYLRAGGGLAEEARWGRVRALASMGKADARDRAIDQLLAAHPQSIYAAEARAMRGT